MNASALPACRSCGAEGITPFLSLGETPLADALVSEADLSSPEEHFPLDVAFCPNCTLVQILEEVPPEKLFVDNYLYFSSFSDHLVEHARQNALARIDEQGLGERSLVTEIASNDGYLLRHFAERGIPVLGIDPAPDQADAAEKAGIPTLREFFGTGLATRLVDEGRRADLIIANNVMAHVPELNDFVEGFSIVLAEGGRITVENPYVRDLIDKAEFDTIYHEHFCYYSCTAVDALVRRHGLVLNHVEHFPELHGGTLRWHISRDETVSDVAREYLAAEAAQGLTDFDYYADFGRRVETIRGELRDLLTDLRSQGKRVAGYGAAAKGSTLLNYVGIGTDLVEYVVDRNTYKQGKHMPGTHQEIRDPKVLMDDRPDYVLLLAWNFAEEISRQQRPYLDAGGRFIVPVPSPRILG